MPIAVSVATANDRLNGHRTVDGHMAAQDRIARPRPAWRQAAVDQRNVEAHAHFAVADTDHRETPHAAGRSTGSPETLPRQYRTI